MMKYIKKFENIDWDKEWDFEEEEPIFNDGEEYVLMGLKHFNKKYFLINKTIFLKDGKIVFYDNSYAEGGNLLDLFKTINLDDIPSLDNIEINITLNNDSEKLLKRYNYKYK